MDGTIQRDTHCFCCGADNERGLHLSIAYPETGAAETTIEVPRWYSGWKDVTHGGFIATLLDEIMAHACVSMSQPALTAEITVRYQKSIPTGSRVRAVGRVKEAKGRILVTQGWIYDSEGTLAAEATARFLVRPKAESAS
jgi:uncharacterized protein (TIGR00369 family)